MPSVYLPRGLHEVPARLVTPRGHIKSAYMASAVQHVGSRNRPYIWVQRDPRMKREGLHLCRGC